MSAVFISHSSADNPVADELNALLDATPVWPLLTDLPCAAA